MNLVEHTSDGLLAAFEEFLARHKKNSWKGQVGRAELPLTQTRALQLIFDVKFLINTLPRKDDSQVRIITKNLTFCSLAKLLAMLRSREISKLFL